MNAQLPSRELSAPNLPALPLLRGQKALITGANSGIGRGVALAMAQAGADIVVNYVAAPETAQQVCDEAGASGIRALAIRADVSDERQVQRMFASAVEQLGTVDILVNNAGVQHDAAFDAMSVEQWNEVVAVNLTGQFLCAREAVREFRRRGPRPDVSCALGKIICISSVHETIPWAGHVNYAASKGGVMQLMKSIAQEVAHERIRVNSICPGAIRTPINVQAWDTPLARAELLSLIPYGRIGEPQDVARAAVWLASDYADYVDGVSLFVDGGMTLYPGFREGG
jgi:glucose 1-dehydrogenase